VSYSHFFRSYGGGSVPIIIGDFGVGSGIGILTITVIRASRYDSISPAGISGNRLIVEAISRVPKMASILFNLNSS
jgi:hypothetical protein